MNATPYLDYLFFVIIISLTFTHSAHILCIFFLLPQNYIKAKRYFVGEPVWKPYNRPSDEMECRKDYLKQIENGFGEETTL